MPDTPPHIQSREPARRARRAASFRTCEALESLEPRIFLAADPVTTNHPLWTSPRSGAIVIDGLLSEPDWADAPAVERTVASLPGLGVTLRTLHDAAGLKVGLTVRDPHLYADGRGNRGSGARWEYWHDDAVALYFDVKEQRSATALGPTGRVLGFNIAPFGGKTTNNKVVSRWNFLRGAPAAEFHSAPVTFDGSLPVGLTWRVRIDSDRPLRNTGSQHTDRGWTAEVNIPWSALGLAKAPASGRTIGMNFEVFFDSAGGPTKFGDQIPDFAASEKYDYKVTAVHDGYGGDIISGWPVPAGYAVLQFANPGATAAPPAIVDLEALAVGGRGARFEFTAPAATTASARLNKGHAAAYEIRLSSSVILTEDDWQAATPVDNTFTPKLRGLKESLRIGGLDPGTTYHVAVRASNAAGRLGALGASASFETLAADAPGAAPRVIISPTGSGLITELGEPFPMVGGTAGIELRYLRTLYGGLIWTDSGSPQLTDFSQPRNPPEGSAADYFAALAATGVNTLRLQLEWLVRPENINTPAEIALFNQALANGDGIRWLERRNPDNGESEFNPEMERFLHRAINAAHAAGIRFVIQTSNNFNYEKFFELTPYAGVIGSMDEFFDGTPAGLEVREMVVRRLKKLADWVDGSDHPETVIGLELYNEWNDVKNPAKPAGMSPEDYNRLIAANRRTELTKRVKFLNHVSDELRADAPELLIFSSTIGTEPAGVAGRALFYSDIFDVLDPHWYTPAVSQPVDNTAADRSVRVARDYASIAAYWLTSRRDDRPIHNGEWDLASISRKWPTSALRKSGTPYYSDFLPPSVAASLPSFTRAEDEANFRVASWTSVAAGLAGAGWRIGSGPLRDSLPTPGSGEILTVPLSPAMRATQLAIADFYAGDAFGFDWSGFRPRTLAGRIHATSSVAVGSTDSRQGLVYILRSSQGSDVTLTIEGLTPESVVEFEPWSTDSTLESPASRLRETIEGATDADGTLSIVLAGVARDLALKFRVR